MRDTRPWHGSRSRPTPEDRERYLTYLRVQASNRFSANHASRMTRTSGRKLLLLIVLLLVAVGGYGVWRELDGGKPGQESVSAPGRTSPSTSPAGTDRPLSRP
jgi:hypothetical protein